MKKNIVFIYIMACTTMSILGQSTRYYVDQEALQGIPIGNGLSWDSAFVDLQDALGIAQVGDTIWVASGIYKPIDCTNCGFNDRLESFVLGSGVQLYGGFVGTESHLSQRLTDSLSLFVTHPTILSGDIGFQGDSMDNSFTIVTAENLSNSTMVDGFMIQGGNADLPFNIDLASANIPDLILALNSDTVKFSTSGGLRIRNSSITVSHCLFRNNYAAQAGAVTCLLIASSEKLASFHQCVFMNNRSNEAGGAIGIVAANTLFEDCSFVNNEAEWGGAIISFNDLTTPNEIINSTFTENEGRTYGGALYIFGGGQIEGSQFIGNHSRDGGAIVHIENERLSLVNCMLQSNVADVFGGGIVTNGGNISLQSCQLIENEANSGGGMANLQSTVEINESLFQGNFVAQRGGAIVNVGEAPIIRYTGFLDNIANLFGGGIYNLSSSPHLSHCRIANNSVLGEDGTGDPIGGGMYNENNSNPILDTCVFEGNYAFTDGAGMYNLGSNPVIDSCQFIDNEAGRNGGGMYNLSSDPSITNSSFLNNKADEDGGALYVFRGGVEVNETIFISNRASISGGGIYHDTLSQSQLMYCNFLDNSASTGGAIFNRFSESEFSYCRFEADSALNGGGMFNLESNPILIHCEFERDRATSGGGIYNSQSQPNLKNCTFSENVAISGAGMRNASSNPILESCTFQRNEAIQGAGLYNQESTPTIKTSLFWRNQAEESGGASYDEITSHTRFINTTFAENRSVNGGAIYTLNSDLDLLACTMSLNQADSRGQAIYMTGLEQEVRLQNTLIAQNSISNTVPGDIFNEGSTLLSNGHNLIGDSTHAKMQIQETDLLGSTQTPIDARLGFLNRQGGSTLVFGFLSKSPARGAGEPINETSFSTDQRGYSRIIGTRDQGIDIGAYEWQHTFVTPANPRVCQSEEAQSTSEQIVLADSTGGAWRVDEDVKTVVLAVPNGIRLKPGSVNVEFEGEGLAETTAVISTDRIYLSYKRNYTKEPNFIRISGLNFNQHDAGNFALTRLDTGHVALQWDNNPHDSVIHAIFTVFPTIPASELPYEDEFKDDLQWFPDPINPRPLWEWGIPSGSIINQAQSGEFAWITDLDAAYQASEDAYLNSPCFDFTGIDNPMIAFNRWVDAERDLDGTVLEAVANDGQGWQTIGTDLAGLNWYNSRSLDANPGAQTSLEKYGWTGRDTTWRRSAHELDRFSNVSSVRFRIIFKSIQVVLPNTSNDGFGLDDVFIGNRSRKVLLEHFADSDQPKQMEDLHTMREAFSEDIISLQYHIEEDDPYYLDNRAEMISRAVLYGVSTSDMAILGGNDFYAQVDSLNAKSLDTSRLDVALFDIHIDSTQAEPIFIRARQEHVNPTAVHVAIVENIIDAESGRLYRHLVRKLLPDAAGTQIPAWGSQETLSFAPTWTEQHIPAPSIAQVYDSLSVIVWIQDLETKEIYDAAISKVWTGLVDPSAIGRKGKDPEAHIGTLIYPNPAQDLVYILLDSTHKDQAVLPMVRVMDMQGRQVMEQMIEGGRLPDVLSVGHLASGMYQLLIGSGEDVWHRERLQVK